MKDFSKKKGIDSDNARYYVLPIMFNRSNSHRRHLYIKQHSGHDSLPKDKTLFIAGIPLEINESSLLNLFSTFGEVERVAIHGSRVSAVVLYSTASGRDAAIKAAKKNKPTLVQTAQLPTTYNFGLKGWIDAHKSEKPGNTVLQERLDAWMDEYETEEAQRKAEALAAMQEDGWTVVQRHKGRKKNASGTGVVVGAVAARAAQAIAAKKQTAAHTDFYRFQQREKRRQDLLDLRQKFEEDKKRLAEIKAARKFKPFD